MIERIHGRATFRRFGPDARRFRRRPLTLVVADRDVGPAAFAYAVSRRVGPAVVRNRLRRQLRAAVVEIDADRPVAAADYLVVVHPPARGAPYQDLLEALRSTLAEAGSLP